MKLYFMWDSQNNIFADDALLCPANHSTFIDRLVAEMDQQTVSPYKDREIKRPAVNPTE